MALFDFFPDRSRAVAKLVEQSRNRPDDPAFSQQVESVFGPLIERRLTASERTNEALRSAIRVELDGLIRSLLPSDDDFVKNYGTVVNDLIDACRWKQFFGRLPTAEIADRGVRYRADIQAQIERYHNDPAATRLRRLTRLLTDDDQTTVARRTLRAFLAYASHHRPQQMALFWLRDGRVQLRWPRFREYLSEQVAFYVYMVHDDQDVEFLLEAMVDVKRWVTNRITNKLGTLGPEELAGIDDIVGQTRETFIQKCRRIRANPDALYIDAGLTTYLIGIVKTSHAIEKLLYPNQPPPTDEEHSSGEDTDRPTRPPTDSADYYDPWDGEHDERWDILRRCLARLGDACRTLIMRHFDNNYGDTVPLATLALAFGQAEDALEKQYYNCMNQLKKLVWGR